MKKKLFISYSKDDREVVDRLKRHLEIANTGHESRLDFFLDTQNLEAGTEWGPTIQQNLKSADGYLFLVSMPSLSSPFILQNELPAMAFGLFNTLPTLRFHSPSVDFF